MVVRSTRRLERLQQWRRGCFSFRPSADHGKTWTAPGPREQRFPFITAKDQFFQWMAVDPQSGAVNLVFSMTRRNRQSGKPRWTLGPLHRWRQDLSEFTPGDPDTFVGGRATFLGDYLAITAFGKQSIRCLGAPRHRKKAKDGNAEKKKTRDGAEGGERGFLTNFWFTPERSEGTLSPQQCEFTGTEWRFTPAS